MPEIQKKENTLLNRYTLMKINKIHENNSHKTLKL